jgi:predicted DNA-binding protein (MmcQ/YjbR family)
MTTPLAETTDALRAYALSLPGAVEEFPWGDRVVKVNKKIFVFLGNVAETSGSLSMSVKLPTSGEKALENPYASPTGYGLGKSGWVSLCFSPVDRPSLEMLRAWVEESYRAVAPKKLVAQLGAART